MAEDSSTPSQVIRSVCPYCGVGCGLQMLPPASDSASKGPQPSEGLAQGEREPGPRPWGSRGDRHHPSSLGQVCIKGATVGESLHHGRLLHPAYRSSLEEPFERISWERAFELLTERISTSLAERGPAALAMYGSGQFHTEDYYTAQKLFKGALGTNNFDANSRLCMSSAVSGYARSLGSDGPPCCYEDIDHADLVVLIGTNTAECHPVLFQRLLKRKKRQGTALTIIVIDPRATATAAVADHHLAISSGTDLALMHGLAHLLVAAGRIDRPFLDQATEGYGAFEALVQRWTPERTAAFCGIPEAALRAVASAWANANAVLSLWSMGLNQRVEGTATVGGLINLHLLTGQIGKPGCGPFSLTGQPNAMGGREAGGLAQLLPGYRSVAEASHRAELELAWGLPPGSINPEPGLTVWQQIEAMEADALDLWWVAATNPLVSLPHLDRVRSAVRRCPMVVLSEAYAGSETAAVAHLLLPAAQWSEKQGAMTNSERRISLCPAFRPAPGEARPDWEVFAELGRRLGHGALFSATTAAEVFAELAAITAGRLCDFSGLSHGLLAEAGPQQWPFPAGSPATTTSKRLYTDQRFATPNGRARFLCDAPLGLGEPPCEAFPLVLTVGRYLGHWHTMTRTGKVARLKAMHPEPLLEVHPSDAKRHGLADGDWATVTSRRGSVAAKVQSSDRIRPGTLFLPMHWGASQEQACEANRLMHELCCPHSRQPELKAAAVRLEKGDKAAD